MSALRRHGKVSTRQLAWLLETAVPAKDVPEGERGSLLAALLVVRMGDAAGAINAMTAGCRASAGMALPQMPSPGTVCIQWCSNGPSATDEAARVL